MELKLSNEQIETYKKFISKRGFTYLDLQQVIINQISKKVEVVIDENPQLNLEDAIRKVHASYGVMGFSTIEDEMQNQLYKKYNKYFWNAFVSAFKPPFLWTTMALALVLYLFMYYFSINFIMIYALTYFFILVSVSIRTYYINKKKKLTKFLSYRVATSTTFLASVIFLQIALQSIKYKEYFSIATTNYNLIITLLFLFVAIFYFAGKKVHKQAIEDSEKFYNIEKN